MLTNEFIVFQLRDVMLSLLSVWSPGGGIADQNSADENISTLLSLLPPPEKRSIDWKKLTHSKDKALHRLLTVAVTPSVVTRTVKSCAIETQLNNRTALKGKLESKSALGIYVGMLFDIVCSDMLLSGTGAIAISDTSTKLLLAKIMPYVRVIGTSVNLLIRLDF